MFTIKDIRLGNCDDCRKVCNGVQFAMEGKKNTAFLCWKHFRKTLRTMNAARMLPKEAWLFPEQSTDTRTPPGVSETSTTSKSIGHSETKGESDGYGRSVSYGQSKGSTDIRDTGDEG